MFVLRTLDSDGKDQQMELTFDLPGKIRTTQLYSSHGLQPVFEAVANSIQAIEDADEPNGRIEVKIDRGGQMSLSGSKIAEPPQSFSITDNGVGFTTPNFDSYFKAYSSLKANRGCKGVGRFLALKAFARVEIDSTYEENKKVWRRRFWFVPTIAGIEKETLEEIKIKAKFTRATTVTLVGWKERFRSASASRAETIAQRIVEYCLPHFINNNAPQMAVVDSDGQEYPLNHIFDEMKLKRHTDEFKVGGCKFKLTHLMVPASRDQVHRLHFCANGWTVRNESIIDRLPELHTQPSPLRDMEHGGRQMYYAGFLSGTVLDECAGDERTDFAFDDETDLFGGENAVKRSDLMAKVVEKIDAYLSPHLKEVREQRDIRIREYVETDSPQYRPLVKHRPELLADIPPNLPPDKLEVKLYEANQQYNIELSKQYEELLQEGDKKAVDRAQHKEQIEAFLEEWNEAGTAKLAFYVRHRKAVLDLLDQELALDQDGNYKLEDAIHKLVFPLKTASSDVRWEDQNLWIIDERLTYHQYLASDLEMRKYGNGKAVANAKDRPDIIVFNRPIAVAEDKDDQSKYESVVIIEFKRAMRDDYTMDDNPIKQVADYVEKLQTSREKDRRGRQILVNTETPFYAYVICDVTEKLEYIARHYGLRWTPDHLGFYGYHQIGVYIEVIPFTKLVVDARRRNKVLFDMLGFRPEPVAQMRLRGANAVNDGHIHDGLHGGRHSPRASDD